uniref:Uncharacterized protein n=1 Tax=Anguilla anguilla TaxID=7936 RepID=A0A0E9U117_ANGAN
MADSSSIDYSSIPLISFKFQFEERAWTSLKSEEYCCCRLGYNG